MAVASYDALVAAAKFAVDGHHDRAVKEYASIVDANPSDIRLWLLRADALLEQGDTTAAIEQLLQIAKMYAEHGERGNAVAVFHQVLEVDAERLDVRLKVAGLYKELNRVQDAIAVYDSVAQAYFKSGLIAGSEGLIIVAELEPAATDELLRLAELCLSEDMVTQAVKHFRLAANRLLADCHIADYIRVAERLILFKRDDLSVLRSLVRIYLKQGENLHALVKLQALLQAAPTDPEGLELLGETFVAIGKLDKAISVVMELAGERRKGGRTHKEAAARVLKKALGWGPRNADDIAKILGEIEAEIAELPAPVPTGTNTSPGTAEEAEDCQGDVETTLREASVYVKYRMLDHALGHIDPLFVRDPNHVAALELQVWLLGELGRGLEAANALVRLGEILMASDPTTARAYVERAQKSVPNHIRAELVLAALDASGQNSVGTTPKAPSWADELTSVLAELEADNGIEELEVDEDIDEPSMAAPRRGSGRPPVRSPGTGRAPHASLQRPVRPDDAAVTKVLEVTVPAVPHSTAHTVEQAIHLKPASEPGLTWPDIADELDELRFFITGRFGDDAQFAYLELQRRFPGHPALTEFAERFTLGARLESAAAPVMLADVASAAPPVMPEIGAAPATVFPLEDEDEDSFLASIFDEPVAAPVGGKIAPRRAVATLDDGADAQTFFDLGTAYREMGLIDDALTQFDLAARDHRWTSRARVMMASLGVGRGENDQALADLQTAIDSATDQDEQSEARYELGVLYQALGDTERAISALEAVSAGYRDRDDRLRKILGLITPTQSHNPSPEATALSSNINDPSEPDTRYLEVALPRQLVERKAYPLHVLIRMPGTPTLLARLEDKGVVEKKKFAGGTSEVLVNHPVGPRGEREPISILVWMRSSDFLCPKPCKQMLLYHRRETLSLTFSVTPCVVGTVSLVVEVQIEGDIVGSEPVSRVCVEGTSVRPTQDSTSPSNPGPPPHRPPLVPPKKKLKILMVSASPDDQVRLRVDKEFRDIVARLERTFARDLLQIEQLHAATLADLRTALLRHEPHVLHLSCHGEINGDIVLEGKEQGGQRVVKADILRLLRALRDNLCLVFLNACHSHVLASEVPPNIDLAIGMTDEITDAAAMDIAVAFYETLAYGRTVETAFDTALVGLSSLAQAHIPVLFPPAENDPGKKRSIRLIRA